MKIHWSSYLVTALLVVSHALMLHHYFCYGILFDLRDPVGHDWYGLILGIAALIIYFLVERPALESPETAQADR